MRVQIFLKLLVVYLSKATIDLNLPELQYLADHLHPEECRRLVASLHFTSYEEPRALDVAEMNVSKDIPCIRLLLHWNSEPGEGKGETHEVLQHRLRQIGRSDLADWIGKTVFHELGQEMMDELRNPFKDTINMTESELYEPTATLMPINTFSATEWIAFDTICWVFVIGLSCLALAILLRAMFLAIRRKAKRRRFPSKIYTTLETDDSTETEEDRFDVITHRSQRQ